MVINYGWKRLLSAFLALVMLFSVSPISAFAEEGVQEEAGYEESLGQNGETGLPGSEQGQEQEQEQGSDNTPPDETPGQNAQEEQTDEEPPLPNQTRPVLSAERTSLDAQVSLYALEAEGLGTETLGSAAITQAAAFSMSDAGTDGSAAQAAELWLSLDRPAAAGAVGFALQKGQDWVGFALPEGDSFKIFELLGESRSLAALFAEDTALLCSVFSIDSASFGTTATLSLRLADGEELASVSLVLGGEPENNRKAEPKGVTYAESLALTISDELSNEAAIQAMMNNTAVSSFESVGFAATFKKQQETLMTALAEIAEAQDTTLAENAALSGLLRVELCSAEVAPLSNDSTQATVVSMRFNVTPYVSVETEQGSVQTVLANELIARPLTVRLPVSANTEALSASVFHEGAFVGVFDVQEENGEKFIEFTAGSFSPFDVTLRCEANERTVSVKARKEGSDASVARTAGGGMYQDGDEATVIAYPHRGYVFLGWYPEGAVFSEDNKLSYRQEYTFTVEGDASLIALYLPVEGTTFDLRIKASKFRANGGTEQTEKSDFTLNAGETVFVQFTDSSKDFLYWVNANGNILSTSTDFSFVLTDNMTIESYYVDHNPSANYAKVVFRNAYKQVIFSSGYHVGDTIEFPGRYPSKMGYVPTGWYLADAEGNITDVFATEEAIWAAMAESNIVTIVPGYEAIGSTYTVNVSYVDGNGPVAEGKTLTAETGEKIDVVAPEIEGLFFQHWTIDGKIVGYDKVYSVLRAEVCEVELVAVYGEEEEPEQAAMIDITQTYAKTNGAKYVISNTLQYYTPEDFDVAEVGFVYGTKSSLFSGSDAEENLQLDKPSVYTHVTGFTVNRGLYTFNGTVSKPTTTLYIRAYIIYRDAKGVSHTLYSPVHSGSYNSITATPSGTSPVEEGQTQAEISLSVTVSEASALSATATVPSGTKVEEEAISNGVATLEIVIKNDTPTVTLQAGDQARAYNVEIHGVDAANSTNIVVRLIAALPAGASNVDAYHAGAPMTAGASAALTTPDTYYYDAATGDVYICVTHFSNYTFSYQQVYPITYEGLNGATNLNPLEYVAGEVLMLQAPLHDTLQFDAWLLNGEKVTEIPDTQFGPITLTATWFADAPTFTITWKDEDGTVLATDSVSAGDTPSYSGTTPTKAATAQYTYTFAGWTPEIVEVTEAAIYTARYSSTVNEYTISFLDEDGTELQSGSVAYGETPVYSGATPTKAATTQYTYTFAGWTPEIVEVTGATTYTATFNAIPIPTAIVTEITGENKHTNIDIVDLSDPNAPAVQQVPELDKEYKFTADTPSAETAEHFGNWYADYRVSFDRPVAAGSFGLYGAYSGYGTDYSMAFLFPSSVNADAPVYLLEAAGLSGVTYNDVVNNIGEFVCGVFNLDAANKGTTMTVQLVIWDRNADASSATVIASQEFVFGDPAQLDCIHSWGTPTYVWNADNSSVTATRVCAHDANHVETEPVSTTAAVTKKASASEAGETTYTATFADPFATQQKTVANIPAGPVTVSLEGWTYGAAANAPTASGAETGAANFAYKRKDAADTDYSAEQPTDAGTYVVRATVAETANYLARTATAEFTIAPKSVSNPTIVLSETEYTYDGSAKTPTVTVKDGETTIPDAEYAVSYSNNTNAGTATVTITDKDGGNYAVSGSTDFTINKADINPTVTMSGWTYGGTASTLVVSGNSGNGAVTYAYKVQGADDSTYTATKPSNAGSYIVKATVAETTNYNGGTATTDFTIAKAALTVTANNKSITYGDAPTDNGVSYSGFVNNETASVLNGDVSYAYSYAQYGNVGNSYTITPSGLTSDNYDITFNNGTLSVEKRPITVKAKDQTVMLPDTITTTGDVFTLSSGTLADGQTATVTVATTESIKGTYADGITVETVKITAGETDVTANYAITTAAGDLTIEATASFTVTYMVDEVQSGDVDTVDYGMDVELRDVPTRVGYTAQWTTDDAEIDGDGFRMPKNNVTLTAAWTANEYTVTLNAQGGIDGSVSVIATYDAAMPTATMPTLMGYAFSGYFDAETGGAKYYNADGTSAKTWDKAVDTTLYAQWTANTYAVTLNANGGAGGTTSVTATYDAAMPTATMPTRTGYIFTGYFDAETNGTKYYNADGTTAANWNRAQDSTLYAQWSADSFSFVFNVNTTDAVSGEMSNQIVWYDDSCTLEKNAFTYSGHVLTGWNTEEDPSGENPGIGFADGDTISRETVNALYRAAELVNGVRVVNLYAQWAANSVILHLNGGELTSGVSGYTSTMISEELVSTAAYIPGTGITLPVKEEIIKSGFMFKGWYDNSDYIGDAVTATGQSTEDSGVKEYWAKWNLPNSFTNSDNFANINTYLYRVGNNNTVKLGSLFKVGTAGTENVVSTDVAIKIEAEESTSSVYKSSDADVSTLVSGSTAKCIYTKNANDWTQSTLQFEGEGPVKVSICEDNGEVYTIRLEVVSAFNMTSYGQWKSSNTNMVLLNNITLTSNAKPSMTGNKLFGNGFIIDATAGMRTDHGVIFLYSGAQIDNAIINGPVFTEIVGSANKDGFASTIAMQSNSVLSNCHVTGGRGAVRTMGNCTIRDSILAGGILANLLITGGDVTVENLTTINTQNSTAILFYLESTGSITINGTLTQHNFISENAQMSGYGGTIKNVVFGNGYSKYHFTDGTGTRYVNMGIISATAEVGAAQIIDNRVDKQNYSGASATLLGASGYVYTMENTDSSMLETSYSEGVYKPTSQEAYEPSFVWSLGSQAVGALTDDTYCLKDSSTVKIQFPKNGSFELNALVLPTIKKYNGKTLTASVTCKNQYGVSVPITDGKVTFTTAGDYSLIYTYTDDAVYSAEEGTGSKTYNTIIPVTVNVKKSGRSAIFEETNCALDTILYMASGSTAGYGSDFQANAPALTPIIIKDYDKDDNEIVVLDGINQADFVSKIAEVKADSDERTGYTIYLINGTKLHVTCSAPYHSQGKLKFHARNNTFYMYGTTAISSRNKDKYTFSWSVTKYSYTGLNGTTVDFSKTFTFSGAVVSNGYTSGFSDISSAKSLIYVLDGGEMPEGVDEYTIDSPATLPLPTKTNFNFLAWNTEADGTGTSYDAGDRLSFSSLKYLYAQWYVPFVVSFNANEGECEISSATYNNEPIALPLPSRVGHWFVGWYSTADGGTLVGAAGDGYTPTENTVLYAHWSPEYTVTYNANEGTVEPVSAKYSGTALILPAPSNGVFPFLGWYTAAEGGEKVGAQGESYTPTSNTTLYAHWGEPITVNYDANGGSVSPTTAPYTNAALTLPTPMQSGQWCTGWYTDASEGERIGGAGESYIPVASITLYAQWSPVYTVTYEKNATDAELTTKSAYYAGTALSLPTPTRTGYTFSGWYTEASGGTKIGAAGASYVPTANITLYAQWTINSYKVTITTSNSSTAVTVNGTTVNSGGSVAYNSVVKVVLSYSQSNSLTFTIKQGNNDVTYYSNEACTTTSNSTAAGTYYFKMPAGDVTINSSSSSGGGSICISEGTKLTLANGVEKPVEDLTYSDQLLVWDFFRGEYTSAPIAVILDHGLDTWTVLKLTFSNGYEIEISGLHGFFDLDENKFVQLNLNNYQDYLNHRFVACTPGSSNNFVVVTLMNGEVYEKETHEYLLISAYHYDYIANGLLNQASVPYYEVRDLYNYFEVGSNMQYDSEAVQRDIETYGLYDYDVFKDVVTYEQYVGLNLQYLKISVGKGYLTLDELIEMLYEYVAVS